MMKNNSENRVLINALTLNVGGGIQIGKGFIEYCAKRNFKDLKLDFLISRELYESLDKRLIKRIKYWKINSRPPYFLAEGIKIKKFIKKICRNNKYNLIYSIGFPSYINFNIPELGRYTNPWEFMPISHVWELLSFKEKIKRFLLIIYRVYWARKANYYETQTSYAAKRIEKKIKIDKKKIFVINNSVNPFFKNQKLGKKKLSKKKIIFCLAADHIHKNILSIPLISFFLNQIDKKNEYVFYITVPNNSKTWIEIKKKMKTLNIFNIVNLGKLNLSQCKKYYIKSDCILQPSLLEVFSATYIEAMQMKKPLIIPNLKFTRDICGDGAIYYKYNSPLSAAKKIFILLNNNKIYRKQIKKGSKVFEIYPSLENNVKKIISILKEIIRNEKYK